MKSKPDHPPLGAITVTRESEYRRQRQRFRTCFGHEEPAVRWITIDELYGVLAHGAPGDYVLLENR